MSITQTGERSEYRSLASRVAAAIAAAALAAVALSGVGVSAAHATTPTVTNPGDHNGGVEDLGVQQGGQWTFNAKDFAGDGFLEAWGVVGGVNTKLEGVGQYGTSKEWVLDPDGHTSPITRLYVPASVPVGSWTVTFTDNEGGVVAKTLQVEALAPATIEVVDDAGVTVPAGEVWIRGTGWTSKIAGVGSTIAIKLNEGGLARTAGNVVHGNPTIWTSFTARGDGQFPSCYKAVPSQPNCDFYYQAIKLPTSTPGTWASSPSLSPGTHTLSIRALSGHLAAPNDNSRTLSTGSFSAVIS